MIFGRAYSGTLVAFLAIDLVWIGQVAGPMYRRQIAALVRAEPELVAAAVFYLAYAAGVVYFAVLPALDSGGVRTALLNGGLLGGLAYGTYGFTNYAMLEGWPFGLTVADLAWGALVTALAATGGLLASRPRAAQK